MENNQPSATNTNTPSNISEQPLTPEESKIIAEASPVEGTTMTDAQPAVEVQQVVDAQPDIIIPPVISQPTEANQQQSEQPDYTQEQRANQQQYSNQQYTNQQQYSNQQYNNQQPYYNQQPPVMKAPKDKTAAGILGILLGSLGIHKFYLGYTVPAVIMLVVTIVGSCFIVGPVVMGLIGLIEGIMYLTKSDEDFQNTYVNGYKPWF